MKNQTVTYFISVSFKCHMLVHFNTRFNWSSLVSTLPFGLGSTSAHYLGGPDWRGVHNRIRLTLHAIHFQLVAGSLSLWSIVDVSLIGLVHFNDLLCFWIAGCIFESLLLYWI